MLVNRAMAAVLLLVWSAARRRWRTYLALAVLVLRVVIWQAIAFSLAAVAVGLPLGIAAGRWAWILFAGSAGAPAKPVVPVLLVLAFVPATLLVAALVAAVPGRSAGRLWPASVLRAE